LARLIFYGRVTPSLPGPGAAQTAPGPLGGGCLCGGLAEVATPPAD
jgi:hypothetical protein